MTLGSFE